MRSIFGVCDRELDLTTVHIRLSWNIVDSTQFLVISARELMELSSKLSISRCVSLSMM